VRELSEQTSWSTLTGAAEVDWSIRAGDEVLPASDGLLGLIFVGGRSRQSALQLSEEVLSQLWMSGSLNTNERFILELVQHPWVKDGIYHAGFVDEEFIPLVRPSLELLRVGISISAQASQLPATWTASGLKLEPDSNAVPWEQGPDHWIQEGLRGCSGRIKTATGDSLRICAFPVTKDRWQVRVGSWWISVRRWEKGAAPQLFSLANGKIHSILFREGTRIPAHESILMVESLQTLIPHAVPTDVSILKWRVKPGDDVSLGQPLADLQRAVEGGS
jgi:acetyl/propionyl-CoA carboxylase alpha subunit